MSANVRISNLPSTTAAAIVDTDILPIVTGIAGGVGVTSKVTVGELRLELGTNAPGGGRTVTSTATYLANNAVYNVKDFGAVGDGNIDDTAAIQLAIDTAITDAVTGGGRAVYFPGGKYKTTDTIHVGAHNVAAAFRSVFLIGDGYKYAGQNGFPGPVIIPTQVDRPAVNFQGARGSMIKGITILGKLEPYITAQNFGRVTVPFPTLDDTLAASWDDPGLGGATLDTRYAPYAAITIDAWAGSTPGATHYPTTSQAFGQAASSDVLIEDVAIRGFTVAVAIHPSDSDGNGDFTSLRRVLIDYCKWGISVGQTQSRNVEITQVKLGLCYAALTNNKHGRQNGKFGGAITDLSAGVIKVFEFGGTSVGGPISFTNCYFEALYQIGSSNSPSSAEQGLAFHQCQFAFEAHVDARGYPAYLMELNGSGITDVFLDGCTFGNYKSIAGFRGAGYRVDGCSFFPNSTRTNPYEKFAHNALVGGAMFYQLGRGSFQPMRFRAKASITYNVDTAASIAAEFTERIFNSDRARLIPFWGESVAARSASYDNQPMPFRTAAAQSKGALSALSLSGSTLTITFVASRSEFLFNQYGPLPGDVVWDDQTGSVFFVRSRIGDVVLAELQNNYKLVAGVVTPIVAFSTTVGNLYFRNARIYTPPHFLRCDTTAANAGLTNCARDDGFAAWYDAEIGVDDYILLDEEQDRIVGGVADSHITARNQAAGTITLAGASMRATQIRRRMMFFSRLPPANV